MSKLYIAILASIFLCNFDLAFAQSAEEESENDRDLSLVVDEILVKRGALRKSLSFFFNSDVDASDDFIGLRNTSDSISATFGLRYGFSSRFETGLYASWLASNENNFAIGSGSTSHDEAGFRNLSASISYRVMNDDGVKPALILSASSALVERDSSSSNEYSFGKTNSISARMYKVIDPVIVAGTLTYQRSEARSINDIDLGARDSVSISPTVSVAFNDRVTLSTGFTLSRLSSVVVNSLETAPNRTSARLNLGLGYVTDNNRSLRIGINTELLGDRAFGFNVGYDF